MANHGGGAAVGVDVSKTHLDAWRADGGAKRFGNFSFTRSLSIAAALSLVSRSTRASHRRSVFRYWLGPPGTYSFALARQSRRAWLALRSSALTCLASRLGIVGY